MTTAFNTTFGEIVAGFDNTPRCEHSRPCTRPARWRINLHGCEQANMCGQHKAAWLRRVYAEQSAGQPRCVHCGRVFADVAAAATVSAI